MRQTTLAITLILSIATSVNALQLKKNDKVLAEAEAISYVCANDLIRGFVYGYDGADMSAIKDCNIKNLTSYQLIEANLVKLNPIKPLQFVAAFHKVL